MIKQLKLFNFNNTYSKLPEQFYRRIMPVPVKNPSLIVFNRALAMELGMRLNVNNNELAEIFSGSHIPEGADPLAMAYAGHQFGHFVSSLGDGRSILLGEIIDDSGIRHDIQLKGSGQTPFARNGDGRAALGPVIREYIVSEAMHALGIKTTRSLAAVTTGEVVYRETVLPGAILTRVALSHIRIGTFEYFVARGDISSVKILADYVIARHYPEAKIAFNSYLELLKLVIETQAKLVASWMHVGFIHGVMNTDNMAISGETLDYGPCAFMDDYDPMKSFSSIDRYGRYAFGNQPIIAQWNLSRLAETLLPLISPDINKALYMVTELLETFTARFHYYWLIGMRKKLGLTIEEESDSLLIQTLLDLMHVNHADYTITFRLLCNAVDESLQEGPLQQLFVVQKEKFSKWLEDWRERLRQQPQTLQKTIQAMRKVNPVYIPRNHRIESVIITAIEQGNFLPMERLIHVLSKPYEDQDDYTEYSLPPLPEERIQQTFCGT